VNKLVLRVFICLCIFPVDIANFPIICLLLLKNTLGLIFQVFVLTFRLLKLLLNFIDLLLNPLEVFLTSCIICAINWGSLIIRLGHGCVNALSRSTLIKILAFEWVFFIGLRWWLSCLRLYVWLLDHILWELNTFLRKLRLWCDHWWVYLRFEYITLHYGWRHTRHRLLVI